MLRSLFVFLVFFLSSFVSGQTWTKLLPSVSPSERDDHAMAYDVSRQRVVLFGGFSNSNSSPLNDTWEWDGGNWLRRTPATSPSQRHHHAMTYDTARHRVILFGGSSGGQLNDTWEWDGSNWIVRNPATSPSPRYIHSMAYDSARNKAVLFGGSDGRRTLGDTWEWNGNNWVQLSPNTSPFMRHSSSMAYDAARRKVVLFGGDASNYMNDTWGWDGNNWVQYTSTATPSPRAYHDMAYNAVQQRIVLFGGTSRGSETWEWDGVIWIQITPCSGLPSPRSRHAMSYDLARNRIVLFGGDGSNETWEYIGGGCGGPASYSLLGTSCRGSLGLPSLTLNQNQLPRLGGVFSVVLGNLPKRSMGLMLMGASKDRFGPVALPLDLSEPWGLPGCRLYTSIELAYALDSGPFGSIVWGIPIPDNAALMGKSFFNQAVFADSLANRGGYVLTNAGEGIIGR